MNNIPPPLYFASEPSPLLPVPEDVSAANQPSDTAEQQPVEVQPETNPADNIVASDFVKKLYQIINNETLSDVCKWKPSGESFMIMNPTDFAVRVLPSNFKHSNFSSFVRQLNKYDFHKVLDLLLLYG